MGLGRWLFLGFVIVVLFFMSLFIAGIVTLLLGGDVALGNVAVIPVKGTIVSDAETSIFSSSSASSTEIVSLIEKAESNPSIKAIVFDINSGGGYPVASYEIVRAIESSKKPTVAWIRDVGASGAYWIAASCDHIIASELSMVGSVGAIGSYLEYSGLMERYNVTYEKMTSGKYKDIGSPYRETSDYERALLQQKIDMLGDMFLEDVAQRRNLDDRQKQEISTAIYFLGIEGKDLGLLDEFGGKPEAKAYLEKELNEAVVFVDYDTPKGFAEILAEMSKEFSYSLGEGIGNQMFAQEEGLLLG